MNGNVPQKWTLADSVETYDIRTWGNPYFGVNEKGHIIVHPDGPQGAVADLKELVDEVRRRGIGLPLLLRFSNILRRRVAELNDSFKNAITEYGYKGSYRGVYPIKVNQVANVVDEILKAGRSYHYGLEAGSKPQGRERVLGIELIVVVGRVLALDLVGVEWVVARLPLIRWIVSFHTRSLSRSSLSGSFAR